MAANYQAFKVTKGDGNSHTPTNDFGNAVETAFNNIGDSTYNGWGDGQIFDPAKIEQTGAASGDWLAWDSAKWDNATPPSTTAVVLADTTLSAPAASFDFTSISGSYKHLYLVGCLRTDRAANKDDLGIRFNNDTGANYDGYVLQYDTSPPSAASHEHLAATSAVIEAVTLSSSAADGLFSTLEMLLPHYAGAANNKLFHVRASTKLAATAGNLKTLRGLGAWRSNSAVTRVTLIPINGTNFTTGSRVTLYGY